MVRVAGSIRIAAPAEKVFETVADSRNEPSFNPAMTGVELLTPEPIGVGTRFRARMGKRLDMLEEVTYFEPHRKLGSVTTSPIMETSGTLTFTPEASSTVMTWNWDVRPKGWFRLLSPLVGPMGRRSERRIWAGLKKQLETVPGPPPPPAGR